jgi:hypothetical protein
MCESAAYVKFYSLTSFFNDTYIVISDQSPFHRIHVFAVQAA